MMSNPSVLRWPAAVALLAASAGALLAACGGGGAADMASGPAMPDVTASYAQGPIDGFGSIIVGGVRFDESTASVSDDDGLAQPKTALKLGRMVQIDASAVDTAASAAKALRVRLGNEVVGPVGAVDIPGSKLTVLGQTVIVNSGTVFDAAITGGLAGIKPGDIVEVHGLLDKAAGTIIATRIEPEPGANSYTLRGVVSALSAAAKTFKIGSELIDISLLSGVPVALADGVVVRVLLKKDKAISGAWVATRLVLGARMPDAGLPARVHGIVTQFTSPTAFELNGLKVDATGATFEDGAASVKLGARLEVYGSVVGGVLVATKVETDDGSHRGMSGMRPFELHGEISALDTTGKTFTLRGLTVSYGGIVVSKGGVATDLVNGRKVEVKGVLAADRTKLTAVVIEFE